MATAYFFRAVAADGKLRTGTLSAETDRQVAAELKRQGLIPVYVGLELRFCVQVVFRMSDGTKRSSNALAAFIH